MESSKITVEELKACAEAIFAAKNQKEEIEKELSSVNESIRTLENRCLEYLSALGLESFKSTSGTVTSSQRVAYTVPKTDTDRESFFNYLREKGVFDGLVTVNYQTLNGWAKKEYEAAKEAGDLFFSIPGLGAPTITPVLSNRRTSK